MLYLSRRWRGLICASFCGDYALGLPQEPICSAGPGQFMALRWRSGQIEPAGSPMLLGVRSQPCPQLQAGPPSQPNDLFYRHTSIRPVLASRASPHSTGLDRKFSPRRCHSRKHAVMKDAAAPSAHESYTAARHTKAKITMASCPRRRAASPSRSTAPKRRARTAPTARRTRGTVPEHRAVARWPPGPCRRGRTGPGGAP